VSPELAAAEKAGTRSIDDLEPFADRLHEAYTAMTKDKPVVLDNVIDAMLDNLDQTSDEELAEDFREDGEDISDVAERTRQTLIAAAKKVVPNRARLVSFTFTPDARDGADLDGIELIAQLDRVSMDSGMPDDDYKSYLRRIASLLIERSTLVDD